MCFGHLKALDEKCGTLRIIAIRQDQTLSDVVPTNEVCCVCFDGDDLSVLGFYAWEGAWLLGKCCALCGMFACCGDGRFYAVNHACYRIEYVNARSLHSGTSIRRVLPMNILIMAVIASSEN